VHRFAILALLAGCYSPNPGVGGPCSEQGFCPAGQMCFSGKCLLGPPDIDAAVDAEIDAGTGDAMIDAKVDAPPAIDAAPDAFVSATWLTPTPIPGIASGGGDSDPCMTPDRLTIAFQRNNDLYLGTRNSTGAAFTIAPLTVLNSSADDSSPALSADGKTMYFTSDRLISNGNDVFVSTFNGTTWSAPTLVTQLSSPSDDGDIGISRDGLIAVIGRSGTAIYKATRATTTSTWGAPVAISNVPRDLFVSRRNGALYNVPTAITELNGAATREASPEISGDDLHMAFEIDGDLFESRR
jgi:hypothetical protein